MTRPSIFAFAGGAPAFLALAAAHHERCLRDPELHHLRAYMEWAVREILAYSPHDAVVPRDLAFPHWSWDGLHRGPAAP